MEPTPHKKARFGPKDTGDDHAFDEFIYALDSIQYPPAPEEQYEDITDIPWLKEALATIKEGGFVANRVLRGSGEEEDEVMQDAENNDDGSDNDKGRDKEYGDVEDEEQAEEYTEIMEPLRDALGPNLTEHIKTLFAIPPALTPKSISSMPHLHQLYALARLKYLKSTRFRGGALGDAMGLGKTLPSIMLIVDTPKEPGDLPWLVVTKKSLISNWMRELRDNVKEENQLKVIVPGPKTTGEELYGYDVVLTNYEFIQRQYSAIRDFKFSFTEVGQKTLRKLPPRPLTCIFSEIHEIRSNGFKGAIFDEAQFIKNTDSATHNACWSIYRQSTFLLSGTLLDNRWEDVHGVVRMLGGHPFQTRADFLRAFGSKSRTRKKISPTPLKIRRLQKFLLGFVIARPPSILNLAMIDLQDVHFELSKKEIEKVDYFVAKYTKSIRGCDKNQNYDGTGAVALSYLIRAMQEATHPRLHEARSRLTYNDVADKYPTGVIDEEFQIGSGEDWCAKFDRDEALDSSRMKKLLSTYQQLTRNYPGERMMIFSEKTAVLDLIKMIFSENGVRCLSYDGRLKLGDRDQTLQTFKRSNPGDTVLLITPATGGTGLNIPEASLIIQVEVWWNVNVENQAYGRAHRPGQHRQVKVRRLLATNSMIDILMLENQRKKLNHNNTLMECLVRADTDGPIIPQVFIPRVSNQ